MLMGATATDAKVRAARLDPIGAGLEHLANPGLAAAFALATNPTTSLFAGHSPGRQHRAVLAPSPGFSAGGPVVESHQLRAKFAHSLADSVTLTTA